MSDADLALSILRKMAADHTDWTTESLSDGAMACIESTWFVITDEEAAFLNRLVDRT